MRGSPVCPTKKRRPEFWLAWRARHLETWAIANPSVRRFRDAYSRGSGVSDLLHANRLDHLRFAGWRRQGLANQGHCQSEQNGSRTQEDETMKKKKPTYKPFDAAAYLDNDAVIAEYLSAAAEDPNPEVFVAALGDVAKARGIAQIAKDAG
jgi:hypothetical protein